MSIHTAKTGAAGIQKAQATQPDLILTDLNLPNVLAEKLITQLSKLCINKPIIVSLSGDDPSGDIKSQLEDSLMKPIDKDDLLKTLQHHLDKLPNAS